ncbi:IS1 family transposase [Candidatus Bealeia paramacronuclearis]|uniref:IS1 family transposase n=1 Tax=Candidatus Bealeia paramacronuclearis TaxID=1921001 RepID=UPI0039C4962C
MSGRVISWTLGRRDDRTAKSLIDEIGTRDLTFITDDWEGFHRLIPEHQLFTGKDLTYPIEQDNSNTRHYLARFRRRSKVTSRSHEMVDLSLLLLYHLSNPEVFKKYLDSFLSIFS